MKHRVYMYLIPIRHQININLTSYSDFGDSHWLWCRLLVVVIVIFFPMYMYVYCIGRKRRQYFQLSTCKLIFCRSLVCSQDYVKYGPICVNYIVRMRRGVAGMITPTRFTIRAGRENFFYMISYSLYRNRHKAF